MTQETRMGTSFAYQWLRRLVSYEAADSCLTSSSADNAGGRPPGGRGSRLSAESPPSVLGGNPLRQRIINANVTLKTTGQEEKRQCQSSEDVVAAKPVTDCHNNDSQNDEFHCHLCLHPIRALIRAKAA